MTLRASKSSQDSADRRLKHKIFWSSYEQMALISGSKNDTRLSLRVDELVSLSVGQLRMCLTES